VQPSAVSDNDNGRLMYSFPSLKLQTEEANHASTRATEAKKNGDLQACKFSWYRYLVSFMVYRPVHTHHHPFVSLDSPRFSHTSSKNVQRYSYRSTGKKWYVPLELILISGF
jgi:hypothetical protein